MTTESETSVTTLVHLERSADGVASIRLDNPKVNALSTRVLEQLRDVARELVADPPGAVIVTGGERIFAAGADISEFGGPEQADAIGRVFIDALDAVASIPRMVIAAVAGYALGGGCEVALACDVRIASENAVFGLPEILLGIIPGGGGTQRLARLVGPSRAKSLVLSGRQVKADEALAIGLADEVVPTGELLERARALAERYAAGATVAQGYAKRAIDRGLDGTLADGLELEHELFVDVFRTDDAGIGIASFRQHGPGKASFTGR
jgi:enoyl-CoA hydratase/carnithine racemase